MRATDLRNPARRMALLRAVLLLVFAGLALRAGHLALDRRSETLGNRQRMTVLRLPPERGLIVDRSGVELAISVDAPSIYVTPGDIEDLPGTTRFLARALGVSPKRIAARLKPRLGWAFVARWVEPEAAERVEALELPGVGVVWEPRRVYPYGELAASFLGFANIDGFGVRGTEQQEDAWLRGSARVHALERDARGRLLAVPGVRASSTTGGDVALTLDAALQAEAEAALDHALAATGARGGIILTLDPRSGDVLALAERPGFDPNRFRKIRYAETRSRAFLDAFEPGSVLKVFLVAGALEAGVMRVDETVDCERGILRIPGKTIRDPRPHGRLDLAGVLRVSSNIGAVKIATRLGPAAHFESLRRFGFGRPTGSGFPFESAGLLRHWSDWRPVDHATIAFGQGISVTAVQLAAATAVIANGGELMRPRLVLARRRPDESWRPTDPVRVRRVLGAETATRMREMMEGVVRPGGTGWRAALRDLRVAGKTGTAQIFDPSTGTYAPKRYHAWFVGMVPAEDPRLVVVTLLEEPRAGLHTGGASAAPLFARVAAAQLARLGVVTAPAVAPRTMRAKRSPASPAPLPERSPRTLEPPRNHGERLLLPDFVGLTVAEVKASTAGTALSVEILGQGRAVAQQPEPGAILAGGLRRVRIEFRPEAERG